MYLYDGARVREQLARLREALSGFSRWRIYYALKANRFPPLLSLLRTEGDIGIDACSPREVACALAAGFDSSEISVTASSLSPADLVSFRRDAVHVNFDQISALRRFGELDSAGTGVGLRVDPMVRVGYGKGRRTGYSGGKLDSLPRIRCGPSGRASRRTCRRYASHASRLGFEGPRRSCVSGGAGHSRGCRGAHRYTRMHKCRRRPWWPAARSGYSPFAGAVGGSDPRRVPSRGDREWSADCLRARHLYRASAGILVTRVTTVSDKRGERWIGLDCGQAVNVYSAHYGLELEMVAVARRWRIIQYVANIVGISTRPATYSLSAECCPKLPRAN